MARASIPPLRVLVAGGGVAGLEALLALRATWPAIAPSARC